jgi:hypothetical protein
MATPEPLVMIGIPTHNRDTLLNRSIAENTFFGWVTMIGSTSLMSANV